MSNVMCSTPARDLSLAERFFSRVHDALYMAVVFAWETRALSLYELYEKIIAHAGTPTTLNANKTEHE
jgi:hypothetical protein